jgi:hypothetical protein
MHDIHSIAKSKELFSTCLKIFQNSKLNVKGPRGVKKKFCDTELSGLSVKNAKIEKNKFFFVLLMVIITEKNKKIRLKKNEGPSFERS